MSYRARGGGAPSGVEWRECANAVWCNGWLDTCQRVHASYSSDPFASSDAMHASEE